MTRISSDPYQLNGTQVEPVKCISQKVFPHCIIMCFLKYFVHSIRFSGMVISNKVD